MNAWVLVAGRLVIPAELPRASREPPQLVIAADGGVHHAAALGVTPQLWVGDFDSSEISDDRFASVPRQAVPRDKDFTDAEYALRLARERGATRVTVWGAFGGRLDHTLALALLAVREHRPEFRLTLHSGDESGQPLIPGEELELPARRGQTLSLIAIDALTDVHLDGVRWPLSGARVPAGSGWTVSNEALGTAVRVRVGGGRGLLLQAW